MSFVLIKNTRVFPKKVLVLKKLIKFESSGE